MAVICRRFLVSGKVQGVFFRASAAREAEQLGLRGWARNLPDGRVEVLAVGEADRVLSLEAWLQVGPPRARVEEVTATDGRADDFVDLEDFRTG